MINLASGKNATQSSNHSNTTGLASNAVDGITYGGWSGNSVTHTRHESGAWWEVDLGRVYDIRTIEIWNRTDCCAERLSNYDILIRDDTFRGFIGVPFAPTVHYQSEEEPKKTFFGHQRGRYVRIRKNGRGFLSLAEVKVYEQRKEETTFLFFADPQVNDDNRKDKDNYQDKMAAFVKRVNAIGDSYWPVENIAVGKEARQSSTYRNVQGVASRAVDGNTDGNWSSKSVTHTAEESNPWWEVDLGEVYDIHRIVIWNRTDCCSDRLSNYNIYVKNTPTEEGIRFRSSTVRSIQDGGASNHFTINKRGQYVRIQLTTQEYLSLAEVQVFGASVNPIKPSFMVMGGDLTQWGGGFSTGINVTSDWDANWDRGNQFVHFTEYFDRDRSDNAIDLPMYVGLGNHDLNHTNSNDLYPLAYNRRMRKYVRTKHQGSNAEVRVGNYDAASGSFSWIINGVHFMQFHRFGGDNIHNIRQDGQSRPGKFYLTEDYIEPNNNLEWIKTELRRHSDKQTVIFQHYGWDELGTEKDSIQSETDERIKIATEYYAWWTPAAIKALDATLVAGQKKIIRFFGHNHGGERNGRHHDAFGNSHTTFCGQRVAPKREFPFLVVKVSADKRKMTILEMKTRVYFYQNSSSYRAVFMPGKHWEIALALEEPLAQSDCNCPPKTFRRTNNRTWVEFRLPRAPFNETINIGVGAFNKYYNWHCNRVWWNDQKFICNINTCKWERVEGKWGADARCHGSKGNSPYVYTGKDARN